MQALVCTAMCGAVPRPFETLSALATNFSIVPPDRSICAEAPERLATQMHERLTAPISPLAAQYAGATVLQQRGCVTRGFAFAFAEDPCFPGVMLFQSFNVSACFSAASTDLKGADDVLKAQVCLGKYLGRRGASEPLPVADRR
jgi:hypothetical protein